MYSTTFALIVITGIAGLNLFLGFAAALLIGRGPRSLSDVDCALVFRTFPPRPIGGLNESAPAGTVSRPESPPAETAEQPEPAPLAPSEVECPMLAAEDCESPVEERILTLQPLASNQQLDDTPAQQVLNQLLDEWREDEHSEEVASMSMLVLAGPDDGYEPEAVSLLRQAIRDAIRKQIRRDRVLLTPEEGHYQWFSSDVHPEDALMPVERIRQTIQKTRFEYRERPLDVQVYSAVSIVQRDDDGERVARRLRETIAAAGHSDQDAVFLEMGSGPQPTERLEIEVAESSCLLG